MSISEYKQGFQSRENLWAFVNLKSIDTPRSIICQIVNSNPVSQARQDLVIIAERTCYSIVLYQVDEKNSCLIALVSEN